MFVLAFPRAFGRQYCRRFALAIAFLTTAFLTVGSVTRAQAGETPKPDKAKLIAYLRYAEGWPDKTIEVTVDDPKPAAVGGFYEVLVHLSFTGGKLDRIYYMPADGKTLVSGNVYDLSDSPFKNTLKNLTLKDAPSKGPENAAVTIVAFGDFECPYCRDESKVLLEEVPKKYPKEVRVVFKDFPLEPLHTWARKAAIAGHCVIEQNPNAYWAFHETMYAHQAETTGVNLDSKIQEFAAAQNLDTLRLNSCVQNMATAKIVEDSQAEGRALGISQTPTLFINGRMVTGAIPADQLDILIQWELKRSTEAARTAEKCCEVSVPTIGKH